MSYGPVSCIFRALFRDTPHAYVGRINRCTKMCLICLIMHISVPNSSNKLIFLKIRAKYEHFFFYKNTSNIRQKYKQNRAIIRAKKSFCFKKPTYLIELVDLSNIIGTETSSLRVPLIRISNRSWVPWSGWIKRKDFRSNRDPEHFLMFMFLWNKHEKQIIIFYINSEIF